MKRSKNCTQLNAALVMPHSRAIEITFIRSEFIKSWTSSFGTNKQHPKKTTVKILFIQLIWKLEMRSIEQFRVFLSLFLSIISSSADIRYVVVLQQQLGLFYFSFGRIFSLHSPYLVLSITIIANTRESL